MVAALVLRIGPDGFGAELVWPAHVSTRTAEIRTNKLASRTALLLDRRLNGDVSRLFRFGRSKFIAFMNK